VKRQPNELSYSDLVNELEHLTLTGLTELKAAIDREIERREESCPHCGASNEHFEHSEDDDELVICTACGKPVDEGSDL
jgi:peptide subunit release factor 1 (eRF1)